MGSVLPAISQLSLSGSQNIVLNIRNFLIYVGTTGWDGPADAAPIQLARKHDGLVRACDGAPLWQGTEMQQAGKSGMDACVSTA